MGKTGVTKMAETAKRIYEVPVHLCATGFVAGNGKPVGKILGFTTSPAVDDEIEKVYGSCPCRDLTCELV